REDLDTQLLGLPGEPATEIAEGKRVSALVVHERRRQQFRDRPFAALAEYPMVVFRHRHRQRRTPVFPVGDQLIERDGIDHRARKNVRADLTAFFEDADRDVASGLAGKLLEANGRAQARRAGADDHHVILHGFALHFLPKSALTAAKYLLVAYETRSASLALPVP